MRAQLKIELPYTDPPVWRTVVVPHDVRLDRLHTVIQQSLDWDDAHMHSFERDDVLYETPAPIDMDMFGPGSRDVRDERKVTLDQVLTEARQKLDYTYDFGDDWLHQITLEKLLPDEPALSPKGKPKRIAVCVDGANAAPPEDCGGVPGFDKLKAALADPKHPDHDYMVEWMGDDEFDGAEFSVVPINHKLKRVKV